MVMRSVFQGAVASTGVDPEEVGHISTQMVSVLGLDVVPYLVSRSVPVSVSVVAVLRM